MALTRQQIIQNIEAMEEQGASQGEVQEYLSSISPKQQETATPITGNVQPNALTAEERQSAEETGAFFPARTNEGPLTAGLKAVGNTPSSVFNLGKNVFTALRHPVQTAKGIGLAAAGGVRTAGEAVGVIEDTEDTAGELTFDALAQSLKQRFGSIEALQRTATNDPFGFGADMLPILAGGKAITTGSKVAGIADDAARAATRLPGVGGVKRAVSDQGVKVLARNLKLQPNQRKLIAKKSVAGKLPEEWLLERGIAGSTDDMLDDLSQIHVAAKAQVDSRLSSLDEIRFASNPGQDALPVLREFFDNTPGLEAELKKVVQLQKQGGLNLTEMNDIKRMIDRYEPVFKTSGDIKAGAKAQGLANIRNDIKTFIETNAANNGVRGIKELNKETQVSKAISDAIASRQFGADTNKFLRLTDLLAIGPGAFVGGVPGAISAFALKRLSESTVVQSRLAQKLFVLPKKELRFLEDAMETGNWTQEAIDVLNKALNESLKVGTGPIQEFERATGDLDLGEQQ